MAQLISDVSETLHDIRKASSDKQNIKIITIGQTLNKDWSTNTADVE
jgi:hypothetical protein